MASFLIQHKSRFIFSHGTVWCPLKQLISFVNRQETTSAIKFNGQRPYFDCTALHFLCCLSVLEHLNVFEFYSQYEVINKTRKNEEDLMEMINTQHQHPSFDQERNRFIQGICERSKKKLVHFCQYDFLDTKSFNGDILDSNMVINERMELYSRNLLLLFYPFCVKSDLVLEDSYTKKLQSVAQQKQLHISKDMHILNIVQDCKANCFHVPRQSDELEEITEMYSTTWDSDNYNIQDEEDKDGQSDEQCLQGNPLNEFLELLNENHHSNEMDPSFVDFSYLRRKGKHGCGYECLSKLSISEVPCSFINTEIRPTNTMNSNANVANGGQTMEEMDAEMFTKKISFWCSSQRQHDSRKISKTFSRVPHHLRWLKPVGLSKVF